VVADVVERRGRERASIEEEPQWRLGVERMLPGETDQTPASSLLHHERSRLFLLCHGCLLVHTAQHSFGPLAVPFLVLLLLLVVLPLGLVSITLNLPFCAGMLLVPLHDPRIGVPFQVVRGFPYCDGGP